MSTLYPNAIDGYNEIRIVLDRNKNTKIDARDHNDLRSAVISIEETLGINPQGPFGTVDARLSDSYSNVALHASGSIPRHTDDDIDAELKTGTTSSLSEGTVKTQIQGVLNYLNSFYESGGATLIGATGFSTSKNNYEFSGVNVQEQIQEAGDFLDYNVDFLKKAFNSFIVEGMSVVVKDTVNLVVDVQQGKIASNGIIFDFLGSEDLLLLSSPGIGTFYVYAHKVSNSIVISAITAANISSVLNNVNTICILSEIKIESMSYVNLDMRRFGVFVNDKNGFTVGNAPSSGFDGYGCDFISLKSAVKFIELCNLSGNLLAPNKITLVGDIIINTTKEAEIVLPKGLEINGSGNSILYSAQTYLFSVEEDNINIDNLNIVTNFSSSTGCIIEGASVNDINNLKITNCTITSIGSYDLKSFIFLCKNGNKIVDGLVIKNNNIAVSSMAVYQPYPTSEISLISNAIIEGNTFYQTNYVSTSDIAIAVGSYSKVINNFIKGGYGTGIEIIEGIFSDVRGNTIIGNSGSTFYMNNGVVFKNSSAKNSNSIISDNIIRGIKIFGINCKSGSGYLKSICIDNNIIDNSASNTPPINMCAINSYYLTETIVSNNMISYPGAAIGIKTINDATQVIGNYICGVPVTFGNADSYFIYITKPGSVVSQNIIKNSRGVCIYIGTNAHGCFINNNNIYDLHSSGANCISAFGSNYLNISNNIMIGSNTEIRNRNGIYLENCNKVSVTGNTINNIEGTAIYTNLNCVENIINTNKISNVGNGINCGDLSSHYSIKDNFIIYDGYFSISSENAIYNVGGNSVIEGNMIFGFGQNSSNYSIHCKGLDKISIVGNMVLGRDGYECIGIDNSLSENSKICDNYICDGYIGINVGIKNEVFGNRIQKIITDGIVLNGGENSISGNYIYECQNNGIFCIYDDTLISNNYIFMNGGVSNGISIIESNKISIMDNFFNVGSLTFSSSVSSNIFCLECSEISICGNYFTQDDFSSSYFFDVYISESFRIDVSSNYFYGLGKSNITGVYFCNSEYNKCSNNYFYNVGGTAIEIWSTDDSKIHQITGNFIVGGELSPATTVGIDVRRSTSKMLNISGNFIYLPYDNSGVKGIYLGDSFERNILLSSNFIKVENINAVAASFSDYSGMKVIGNVAIGGKAPDDDIWDTGYINSSEDNVYVDNGGGIEEGWA